MPFHQILPSPSTALVFSNELNEGHHDHERLLTSLLFKAVVSVTNKLLQNGGQSLYEVGYLNFVSLLDTYVCISRNFQKYFTVTKKKSGDFMKVLTSFVILLLQLSRINSISLRAQGGEDATSLLQRRFMVSQNTRKSTVELGNKELFGCPKIVP